MQPKDILLLCMAILSVVGFIVFLTGFIAQIVVKIFFRKYKNDKLLIIFREITRWGCIILAVSLLVMLLLLKK